MPEDRSYYLNREDSCSVRRAFDHFETVAEREKAEIKRCPSLSGLFSLVLNKIYVSLFKFIESVIGERLYFLDGESLLPGVSPRAKKLAARLLQKRIIRRLVKPLRFYHDEPYFKQYQVEVPTLLPDISFFSDGRGSFTNFSNGTDLREEAAFLKTLGEAVERFCLCAYREKNFLLSSYEKISQKALDPLSFAGLSPAQRRTNPRLTIDKNSVFRWLKGFSLFSKEKVFIPAQLVYVGYKCHPQEPMIREQISTGAAAAPSLEGALYGGICEAVERDAFMITYFNKLSRDIIDLAAIDDEDIAKVRAAFKRYLLELYIIDITSDIAIPSVMAVIVDKTGVGPVLHMGNKSDLNLKKAILGAIYEAFQGRIGFRKMLPLNDSHKKRQRLLKANPSQIESFEDRFLFWDSLAMTKEINFLFSGPQKEIKLTEQSNPKELSDREKLETALRLIEKSKVKVYGVNITLPEVKEEGISVAKVISPQLQPIYLNEKTRHCWGERLFKVPVKLGYRKKPSSQRELASLPHPFL
jgi:ribosomal protein S12 methylthiotransferase accessory factor